MTVRRMLPGMVRRGGDRACRRTVAPVLFLLPVVLAGCVTVSQARPSPVTGPSATAAASPAPVATPPPSAAPSPTEPPTPAPTPGPTPRTVRVRSGDTLSSIAADVNRSVGQLLTANPWILDPDRLEVGQLLVVPSKNAPETGGAMELLIDPIDDLTDPDGVPVEGDLAADIASLVVGLSGRDLVVEIDLGSTPPRRVTPSTEEIRYTVAIDMDDDDAPDHLVTWSTGSDGRFSPALTSVATGDERRGDRFPGSISLRGTTIVVAIPEKELGGGIRYRVAVTAEQRSGRSGDGAAVTIDRAPDQSWPLPNPRWYEIGVSPR